VFVGRDRAAGVPVLTDVGDAQAHRREHAERAGSFWSSPGARKDGPAISSWACASPTGHSGHAHSIFHETPDRHARFPRASSRGQVTPAIDKVSIPGDEPRRKEAADRGAEYIITGAVPERPAREVEQGGGASTRSRAVPPQTSAPRFKRRARGLRRVWISPGYTESRAEQLAKLIAASGSTAGRWRTGNARRRALARRGRVAPLRRAAEVLERRALVSRMKTMAGVRHSAMARDGGTSTPSSSRRVPDPHRILARRAPPSPTRAQSSRSTSSYEALLDAAKRRCSASVVGDHGKRAKATRT